MKRPPSGSSKVASPDDRPWSVHRRLFALSAPVIGLNVLNVLSLVIDTAMCGRLENADQALAALGFAVQIVFLLMILMFGLSIGTVAIVARAYGAGDVARVKHVMQQATFLTVIAGATVAALGNLFAPSLLALFGASPAVSELGLAYLRPSLTFCVFQYLSILCASTLRGIGNTRTPFLAQLMATGLNVGLNYALIFGHFGFPALGLQGAALGTVISHAFAVAVMTISIQRGRAGFVRISMKGFQVDGETVRYMLRIGTPAAFDMLLLNVALGSLIAFLGRIDEVAVAAHAIGLRVQALAFVPGLGISQATSAMVGQALGAGDPRAARRVVRASILLATSIMSVLAAMIVGAAGTITQLFDVEPGTQVFEYAIAWMRILGVAMPVAGVQIALVGMLQGAGATKTSLRINFVATILFQIPMSLCLGFWLHLGVIGVWLAFPLSTVLKSGLSILAYRRGAWARAGASA